MTPKNIAYSKIATDLENLSLAIVLADPANPQAFKKSLDLLKKIHIQAKKHGFSSIAAQASDGAKRIQQIRRLEIDYDDASNELNTLIAGMKSMAEGDQESAFPAPEDENRPQSNDDGTRPLHPGTLPPHLSMEDFEAFLTSKITVLEELEALILEFETKDLAGASKQIKRLLHTMKGECGFLSLSELEQVCHRTEDLLLMDIKPDFSDTLLRVKDWFQETFTFYAGGQASPESGKEILDLLDAYEANLDAGEKPFATGPCRPPRVPGTEAPDPAHKGNGFNRSVQIDSHRLDLLIDIIGELAIAEAVVTRGNQQDKTYGNALKSLSESTKALQKIGLSLRMVPLNPLFNRMKRAARDLAKRQRKKIEFLIQGETTELDKTLVDGLSAPLIHIIRNSIDHGIENTGQDRMDAGKPEVAVLTLSGFHKGGNLYIELCDDGRGIDRKKLIQKAVKAGIVENPAQLDKAGALNLIFHSGLSTAEQVTDISGRGIGMDVVRTRISELNGSVSLDSEQGKGTRVTIKLPLTLSIMDGMVIGAGNEKYVIPTLSIVSSIAYSPDMKSTAMGKNDYIRVRKGLIPLLDLATFFDPDSEFSRYHCVVMGLASC